MSEVIVRDGHQVMPRFRIFTPGGHLVILMPLSDDAGELMLANRDSQSRASHRVQVLFFTASAIRRPSSCAWSAYVCIWLCA